MKFSQRLKAAANILKGTIDPSTYRQGIWQAIQLDGGFMPIDLANNSNAQIIKGYTENIDVYSIIRKIVDVLKSVDWVIEKKQASGKWKPLSDSPLHELMGNPNRTKSYTWDDIEEMIAIYLLVTGNVYVKGFEAIGFKGIQEIEILPSNAVIVVNQNVNFFAPQLQYYFNFGGSNATYTSDQLKHIKYYNPNILNFQYGLSPLQVAANAIQVGNERWIADASILGNKGVSNLIGDKSGLPMTAEESDKVDEALRQRLGGARKFGASLVVNKDLSVMPLGLSPADMQLLEKGKVTTRALCNVMGLDSSLFNDPDNKTYNNRLEAEKAMYTNCIIPLSCKISEALTQYLCPRMFPDAIVRMRQNFDDIDCLQENKKQSSEVRRNDVDSILKQFKGGFITYNRGLQILGEQAVPGMDLFYYEMDEETRAKFSFSDVPLNDAQNNSQQQNNNSSN